MSNQHENYWHTNYPHVIDLLVNLHVDFTAVETNAEDTACRLAEVAQDFADQYQEAGYEDHDTRTTDDQVLTEWVAQNLGYKANNTFGNLTS